jgi:hypothetical protein
LAPLISRSVRWVEVADLVMQIDYRLFVSDSLFFEFGGAFFCFLRHVVGFVQLIDQSAHFFTGLFDLRFSRSFVIDTR